MGIYSTSLWPETRSSLAEQFCFEFLKCTDVHMPVRRQGSGMCCVCVCHESAFAVGFLGKYGPPCIRAGIFRSVFEEALSGEVASFLETLLFFSIGFKLCSVVAKERQTVGATHVKICVDLHF